MEPTFNYDYYKDKLQDIWTYEESFETFDEWWRVIRNFLEQAFQDGLNACPDCTEHDRECFDSEEGMRTAWEIIDG